MLRYREQIDAQQRARRLFDCGCVACTNYAALRTDSLCDSAEAKQRLVESFRVQIGWSQ